jgi:hypothetical protein
MRSENDSMVYTSGERNILLRLAAIFDNEFSIDWLQELTGLRASLVVSALEEEAKNGLLEKIGRAHV